MKKKIDLFWYWFILVVAFVLCFFAVNDKKVNAYHLDEYGNVVSDNLFGGNLVNGFYVFDYGYFQSDNTFRASNDYIEVESGRDIVLSFTGNYNRFLSGFVFYNNGVWVGKANDTLTARVPSNANQVVFNIWLDTYSDNIQNVQLQYGTVATPYEPYGVWYSESNAEDMFLGRLPTFTSSLTYTNQNTGVTSTINNVNEYIDNSFGYLYFDRLWNYLDSLTASSYDNAKLTIDFDYNLNINTSYVINSNKENYGSGVWFYQDNDLMLEVRNFYENEYCGGAVQYSCNVELNKYVNIGSGSFSFSYLNRIIVWSSTTDERTLTFGYNNIGYNTGYDAGYNVGYNDGKKIADDLIYDSGFSNGYNVGYDAGVNYSSGGGNTLVGLVGAVFTAPVNMLHTIFDFEFLGINLTNFLFSLISLFIVIWLIRKFL